MVDELPAQKTAALLLTARLRIVAAEPSWAPALVDFYDRNRAHLAPWAAPEEACFFTEATQSQQLGEDAAAFEAGTAYRYLLQPIGNATRVIGSIHFSSLQRGASHSATLGFALDQHCEGQALMNEALRCTLEEMFSAHVNLHRVQAAYALENWRSADVLKRLGFAEEGLANDYLFAGGAWRIHRLVALLNKSFIAPAAWQQSNA
jgi:[ribosomal protein S5]-alanine N-acetyltransferase